MMPLPQASPEQVVDFMLQGIDMKVYIAAPFFTPEQITTVATIEDMLEQINLTYFSPRQGGIILRNLPVDERAFHASKVFAENVHRLEWCDVVLAVIDGRDPGTYWECGYAHAKGKRIVTYTAHDYGLNVMLQAVVTAHTTKLPDLAYLLQKGLPDEICALFRTFHPDIT